jgi:hypothetical protein
MCRPRGVLRRSRPGHRGGREAGASRGAGGRPRAPRRPKAGRLYVLGPVQPSSHTNAAIAHHAGHRPSAVRRDRPATGKDRWSRPTTPAREPVSAGVDGRASAAIDRKVAGIASPTRMRVPAHHPRCSLRKASAQLGRRRVAALVDVATRWAGARVAWTLVPLSRRRVTPAHLTTSQAPLEIARGSPNHASAPVSKRVIAPIRSPSRARTMRPVPWLTPPVVRR